LGQLKPHEVRALRLKAEAFSYREIGAMTGWSDTKVGDSRALACMGEQHSEWDPARVLQITRRA